jgi:hypothetical protein
MAPTEGEQAPVSESPPNAPLIELPAELLHTIFTYLDLKDVLAARKACSTLACIGLDHFGDEVALVYHREKFKALTQIAQHPVLSKQMRSLFYIVDRLDKRKFEQWAEYRVTGEPLDTTRYLAETTGMETEAELERRESRAFKDALKARKERLAAVSQEDLQDGYREFLAVRHDQTEINEQGYDHACLCSFFQGCSKIREVTIASGVHCERKLRASDTAYQKTMVRPNHDKSWSDAGADQVCALARAIQSSEVKLDSLTIAGLSHTIFERSTDRGKAMSSALKALVRPLRRLRLLIQAWPPEPQELPDPESDRDEEGVVISVVQRQSVSVYEDGNAYEVLAEVGELRVLKLELPRWNPNDGAPEYVRLDRTLRELHFPHLYELALSQCDVEAIWLVEFLLLHKATLRSLTMSQMSLAEARYSWRDVFSSISCQLPRLQEVHLYGAFHREPHQPVLFDDKYDVTPMSYNHVMERFILRGGTYTTQRSFLRRTRDSRAGENDDHPPHGVSDDGMPPDEPALDYESDEWDDWF